MEFLKAAVQPLGGSREHAHARVTVRGRVRAVAALVLLAALAGAASIAGHRSSPAPVVRTHLPAATSSLANAATSLQGAYSAAVGRESPAYAVWPASAGLAARNPAQNLRVRFGSSGILAARGTDRVGMQLQAWGEGSSLQSLAGARPRAAGNRVTYALPGIQEWYANGPLGVEQGFTVARAPAARGAAERSSGPLTLALALSGDTRPTLEAGGQGLLLTRAGTAAFRYTGLQATDARGHSLKSWLSLQGGRLLLHVDAADAPYPVRIDPFLQQGEKLTGSGETGKGEFGASVALSSDGNTALIGGSGDNSFTGAAWVFTRSAGTWTQQGEKLTGGGESGHAEFGWSVSLSSEGNTALIGGPTDSGRVGAAWVFTRSGSTWSQQGEKLTGSGETGEGEFGASVRLSSEGTTALIGGSGDNTFVGAAWVFAFSGGKWTQQGAKLTGGEEVGRGEFGESAALAGDGQTAVIGGPRDNGAIGAAWVFVLSAGKWIQQGGKLTGAEETGNGEFGWSVATGSEGNTALIGGPTDNASTGAAWVFTRSGGKWTQQGEKLTGGGESGKGEFGWSVGLSGPATTAFVGAPEDNAKTGAAWVFAESAGKWTQQGEKLTGTGETGAGEFGYSVAVEGTTALVGGFGDSAEVGAAWAFTESAGKWAQQGEKLVADGESGDGEFGDSVAVSAEGNTALVGGPLDDESAGAAWVFIRSGSEWIQQGEADRRL